MVTDLQAIINKVEDVLLETDMAVLMNDSFIDRVVHYNHEYIEKRDDIYTDPRRQNHNLLFIKTLYGHFRFLLINIDKYEVLVSYLCKCQNKNLRYLDAMVLHYNVPVTPVLDLFINRVHKDMEESDVFSFSFEYKNLKFRTLTDEYTRLEGLPDSKLKLSGLVALDARVHSVYQTKTYVDKYEDLSGQVRIRIQALKNLLDMGLLPDDMPAAATTPKKNISADVYPAPKKKTDIIKILSAMYDAKMFADKDGKLLTNKQKLMEAFGEFLGEDFSTYSASLSQAKNRDTKTFMKPFTEIERAGERYYNEVDE